MGGSLRPTGPIRPQSHNDWRRKKLVYPSSRVHICLTFAGVGGFALDMASSQPLTQGLPGPLSAPGVPDTAVSPFYWPNAQVPQSPGPCLSYSPFFISFHKAAKGRGKLSEWLSLSQGRETQAFRELAPSHSLLKRTNCEILQKEQRQWSLDGGLPFCLPRTVVGAGGSGTDLAFR